MIRLGYIGLPTAALIASKKINVLVVDINKNVVETINKGKIHIVEFDFKNLNPILFFGRQSCHGNRSFAEQPDGVRITLLTHFFDPSPSYGVGNVLRKLRNR